MGWIYFGPFDLDRAARKGSARKWRRKRLRAAAHGSGSPEFANPALQGSVRPVVWNMSTTRVNHWGHLRKAAGFGTVSLMVEAARRCSGSPACGVCAVPVLESECKSFYGLWNPSARANPSEGWVCRWGAAKTLPRQSHGARGGGEPVAGVLASRACHGPC